MFSTPTSHSCSASMAQCMSKASTTALASNHIQSFELIFPHLPYHLHLQLESQLWLSSVQHFWGDLDPSWTLSLYAFAPCPEATGREMQGDVGGKQNPWQNFSASRTDYLIFVAHGEGSWRATLTNTAFILSSNIYWICHGWSFSCTFIPVLQAFIPQQWAGQC